MDTRGRRPVEMARAIRLAAWILPPQRKDWAEAMLNEMAWAGSRRAALHWMLGCLWSAIRERTSYELGRTLMTRKTVRTLFGLCAASVIAGAGIYALQKPYQRERIVMAVFHGARAPAAVHDASRR